MRNRTKLLFVRKPPVEGDEIVVEFDAEDQVWADWIMAALQNVGLSVRERRLGEAVIPSPARNEDSLVRTMVLVSPTFIAKRRIRQRAVGTPSLVVYLIPPPPLPEFSPAASIFLAGVPEKEAIDRLLRVLGFSSRASAGAASVSAIRYPGSEPRIFGALARNPQFTGREDDLLQLRDRLRAYGTAVVLPVTLHGLGGVGKTQVALEYVHRFKTDYDLVWWIDCGQPQFVDVSLVELGVRMGEVFGISVPPTADSAEAARMILDVLARGAVPRWLLIYDNAEDIKAVQRFLPSPGGHVLITSRNRAWETEGRTSPLPIQVFEREESIAHLRQRVPDIRPEEAERLAELLGDLPLGLATAGAWLAETSQPIPDYLAELERDPAEALSRVEVPSDYPVPVAKAWDLSLDRLEQRSPAAARLFELFSIMAPGIGTGLLYSPAMAKVSTL